MVFLAEVAAHYEENEHELKINLFCPDFRTDVENAFWTAREQIPRAALLGMTDRCEDVTARETRARVGEAWRY
jgi:hypothetical protein